MSITMEDVEKNLKPCPLCGAPARVRQVELLIPDKVEVQVQCVGCGLLLDWEQEFVCSNSGSVKRDINFVEAWNRRTKA